MSINVLFFLGNSNQTIMKKPLQFTGILFLLLLVTACSSSTSPADKDFFVGTYKGSVNFTGNDGDEISSDKGKITVVKVASKTKYNFEFTNGVPNLNGVEFKKDGDKRMVNVDFEDGVQFITIDASTLKMHYSKDGNTWEADVKR